MCLRFVLLWGEIGLSIKFLSALLHNDHGLINSDFLFVPVFLFRIHLLKQVQLLWRRGGRLWLWGWRGVGAAEDTRRGPEQKQSMVIRSVCSGNQATHPPRTQLHQATHTSTEPPGTEFWLEDSFPPPTSLKKGECCDFPYRVLPQPVPGHILPCCRRDSVAGGGSSWLSQT